MQSNWKEKLDLRFVNTIEGRYGVASKAIIEKFIETEIIEKLIEEMPVYIDKNMEWDENADGSEEKYCDTYSVEKQLRAKWLGNNNHHEA